MLDHCSSGNVTVFMRRNSALIYSNVNGT
jgi:hypothetical protein